MLYICSTKLIKTQTNPANWYRRGQWFLAGKGQAGKTASLADRGGKGV